MATAMPGDPGPWPYGWPVRPLNIPDWYPWHWDAPSEPKVFVVTLNGFEETYIIGTFIFKWDARSAAARALLAYRRYWRNMANHDPDLRHPCGTDLHAKIESYRIDGYTTPWWDKAA